MSGSYPRDGYVEAPHGEDFRNNPTTAGENDGEDDGFVAQVGELHWNSGICACSDDIPTCCLGCFCPCVLFGRNVEMLEGKPWVGPCIVHLLLWGVVTVGCCYVTQGTIAGLVCSCVPCYACNYRKGIRTKYNLEDAPCGDALTHSFCHLCANCQEHRELVARRPIDDGFSVVEPPVVQSMGASSAPPNELDSFPN